MTDYYQPKPQKQVRYVVLGEDDHSRKAFIDAINRQNKQSSIAVHSTIQKYTTLKDRQDCHVKAIMTDIPMNELHRVKSYWGNCQGVILILTSSQALLLRMDPEKFNISKQIISSYCQLFQQQLENNNNVKASKIKTKRQNYPKLIVCSYHQLNVQKPKEIFNKIYNLIKEINDNVWNYISENNCRSFIFDQTYDWVFNSSERQSNIELIRSQLKMNNYNIRESVEHISEIYEQSYLLGKKSKYRPRQTFQQSNQVSTSKLSKKQSEPDVEILNQRKSLSQMPSNHEASREQLDNKIIHEQGRVEEQKIQKKHCTCSIQ